MELLWLVGSLIALGLAGRCMVLLVAGETRRRARALGHVRAMELAVAALEEADADRATYLRREGERRAREELRCGCDPMEYGQPCRRCRGSCACHGGTIRIPGIWEPQQPRRCARCGLVGDCRSIGEALGRRMSCSVLEDAERRRAAASSREQDIARGAA